MDYIVTSRVVLEDTPALLACQPRLGHLPQIINIQCSPNFKVAHRVRRLQINQLFSKKAERTTMENYVNSYKVGSEIENNITFKNCGKYCIPSSRSKLKFDERLRATEPKIYKTIGIVAVFEMSIYSSIMLLMVRHRGVFHNSF